MVGDEQHANALRELAAAYYIAQLMCLRLSNLFVGCREDIHAKLGPSFAQYLPPDKPTETPMQTALRSRM